MTRQGLASQCTVSVRTDAVGNRLYTGIWSSLGAAAEARLAYGGYELVYQPQWDVAVSEATPTQPSAKYAALWHANLEFESRLLSAVPIGSVIDQLRPLIAENYRPVAIAVDTAAVSALSAPSAAEVAASTGAS